MINLHHEGTKAQREHKIMFVSPLCLCLFVVKEGFYDV